MRLGFAAAFACVLALAGPSAAQTAPGWTYGYADGAATATRTEDGRVTATISCRPPDGQLVVTDHTFARAARGVRTVQIRIGQGLAISVPATSEGRGRNARVIVNLPQRPPILAGVQPQDELAITVSNVTHTYGRGSGVQMEQVAYACWSGGT